MIVVWRVTQRCNLSCPFCGYDRRLDRPRRDADIDTIDRFGAVLAEYQRATGDDVLVSWMGGEPLLWPPLQRLTERFTRQFGVRVSTTTNGTPLASAVVRRHILEHYSEVTISVDGIGRAHDDLRGWRGGFAQLRRVIPALIAERRANYRPAVRVNVVLMHDTIRGFSDLCDELAGWGIDEITFNQLGGGDRPEFFPAHRLSPADAEWLSGELPRIRQALARRGVALAGGAGYVRRLSATANGQRIAVADCEPGQRFLFVDELGRVSPCSFAADEYYVPCQEIETWQALQALPRRFTEMRAAARAAACGDCHSTQVFEKFNFVPLRNAAVATRVAPE